MNPIQILMNAMGSPNPMQVMNLMFGGNPMFQRAIQMAKGKNSQEIEEIAKNLCGQMGIDYNSTLSQFQSMVNRH